jgi:hypothetical protein
MYGMRKLLALVAVSMPLVAAAQPPPPPPPPPGGGMGGGEVPMEPKMRFEVGLSGQLPQGDWNEDVVDTSPGLDLAFHYGVAPAISIFAGLRVIAIQANGDDTDITHYDLQLGGRYAFAISPTAKIFAQAHLGYATLMVDSGGESESESGLQFGGKGGAMFNITGRTAIGGALSFTSATIDITGFGELEDAWLGVEAFVSFGF